MKKYLSVLMSIFLTIVFCSTCFANEQIQADPIVNEKIALRKNCIENRTKDSVVTINSEIRELEKRNLIAAVTSGQIDIDMANAELEKLGVYALESSVQTFKANLKMQSRSIPGDISLNSVIIYYDSVNDTWELGGGGSWYDDGWMYDFDPLLTIIGRTSNVGGVDGLGIALYNTYGTYTGCTLEESWIYVSAGGGELSNTFETRSGSFSAQYGVFHTFQDYAKLVSVGTGDDYIYFGRNFSICASYSSEFENYHGYAVVHYVHTWDNSSISSVSVDIGADGVGFSVNIVNQDKSFEAISTPEVTF